MISKLLPGREEETTEGETAADEGGAGDTEAESTPDSDKPEDLDESADGEGPSVEYNPSTASVDSPGASHQALVAPDDIEQTATAVRTGDAWARTLWVAEYPDAPVDGIFEHLYATAETRNTDIAMHIDPRDTQATLDSLENRIDDLVADLEFLKDKQKAAARGIEKDLQDYRELYDTLRNTPMQAFDVSMYLTVRGKDRDALDVDPVTNAARRSPSNLTPVTPRWDQLDSLIATSPVGVDALQSSIDTTTPMLGAAVGAMFPFVAGSFAQPGIEYGTYALNESPLIFDRFSQETGYCAMVIGKLGAGKSFSTKLQLVRRAMYDRDTMIVMLDPLEGFAGVNDALGGERITVGGTRGFNPLELRPTPEHILADVPDLDPWSEQIAWVLTFFETFFEHVANNPLGDRKQTLRRTVQEAYERKGITRDPATHDRESPTIADVIDVLEHLLEEPTSYGYATDGEQERVQEDARSLLTDMRPSFREGGDLENLTRTTGFDLDNDVVYLDLHQEESTSGRTATSLMMQVLFNAVYERAKQTDKRVVFVIDEAHYLMNDATSLDFLETAVRHSRHYDLSLHFISQTGGEFALTPAAQTIANLCSMTLIHRVDEEAEKLAEWFGLSEREVNWVRTAKAGNDEDGFSEALLGIDEEGWFPLRVRASEFEADVIDGGAAVIGSAGE